MTDRELLELAAKAAGITICKWWESMDSFIINGGDWWNPLLSDGDALRLAVGLKFHICPISTVTIATIKCPHHIEIWREDDEDPLLDFYYTGGDIYDATRRAIVKAAAEIGRNKEQDGGGV